MSKTLKLNKEFFNDDKAALDALQELLEISLECWTKNHDNYEIDIDRDLFYLNVKIWKKE